MLSIISEIDALQQRLDYLTFLLSEAEDEEYFSLYNEIEHLEHQIELKTAELDNVRKENV